MSSTKKASARFNLRLQTISKRQRSSSSTYSTPSSSSLHIPSGQLSSPMQLRKRRKMDLGPIGAKKGAVHLGNDQLVPGEEVVKVERCVEKEEVLGLYEEDEKECMSLEDEECQDGIIPGGIGTVLCPRGLFSILPNEIFHFVLSLLSHSELCSLSLTCREMNDAIRNYTLTQAGTNHVLCAMPPMVVGSGHLLSASPYVDENGCVPLTQPDDASFSDVTKQFNGLGNLMKQLTILLPLKSRLKIASFFLNKLDSTHQALVLLLGHSAAYFSFGQLFFTFVRGWGDMEKVRAYALVQTVAKLEERVEKVVFSSPTSFPLLERDVRLVHRRVFLDHALAQSEKCYAFWLTQILKAWPIVCQARLLYLVTAPEDNDGFISWTEVCGCSHLQHVFGTVDFSELAKSLRLLLQYSTKDWKMADIISIIDELTSTPNSWCLENVAQLLIHCGQAISKAVLGCRAGDGHVDEVAVICFYLGNSCCSMKDGSQESVDENITWFLEVLHCTVNLLPQNISKSAFISSVVNKWKDYLTAMFEDCTPDDTESDEVQMEFLDALGNLTKIASRLLQAVFAITDST